MEIKKLKAIRDGLVSGLICELSFGLVFILAFNLTHGIVGGLVFGLVFGILGYFDSLSDMEWEELINKSKKEKK